MVYYDLRSKIFVIRTDRDSEQQVQFAITLIKSTTNNGGSNDKKSNNHGDEIIIRCLRKSGSLRTCSVALIEILNTYCDNYNKEDYKDQYLKEVKLLTNSQ